MKTILSIPSGYRVKKLLRCIEKWRKVCDFEIHVITWDDETFDQVPEDEVTCYNTSPNRKSFAQNHNYLAANVITKGRVNWDIFICGADDLYPGQGINLIEPVCEKYSDKVIWVRDGLMNQQPTHPIITRGWYDKHGYIFDEDYRHNFCDSDLFIRLLNAGEIVKCFDIWLDHRHPIKTGEKYDMIYNIGNKTYAEDERRFNFKHPFPEFDMINTVPEVKL